MKIIKTRYPSFPTVKVDRLLKIKPKKRWQVICGDRRHYRIGIYSPEFTKCSEINILERHNCPEFFMLIKGKISLLIIDDRGRERILRLEPFKPVLVEGWHNGFSPDGKFKGVSIVVERDEFTTIYRTRGELQRIKRR
ncbi:MAG: hypothetical protein ACPL7I_08390 [Myxococcota bacterium]